MVVCVNLRVKTIPDLITNFFLFGSIYFVLDIKRTINLHTLSLAYFLLTLNDIYHHLQLPIFTINEKR